MTGDHIKASGKAGRMGARLLAVVAEGNRHRIYLTPTRDMEEAAGRAAPTWRPEGEPVGKAGDQVPLYGMNAFGDLFMPRQLVALTTFSDLVREATERMRRDAVAAMLPDDASLNEGGSGAAAYAEAIGTYLAFAVDYGANYWSSLATPGPSFIRATFARQALSMNWDFAEAAPFSESSGNWMSGIEWIARALEGLPLRGNGWARQMDATTFAAGRSALVSTDPPYYDNVAYADLSEFFYVWLRQSLKQVFPDLFAMIAVPKAEELVATPYRHASRIEAERFFLAGMSSAIAQMAEQAHPALPTTIYYAFKQSETKEDGGTTSTGWETFLDAVIRSGFSIAGTWPMRTERSGRSVGIGANVLASSIVLSCRKRSPDAPSTTRRGFLDALHAELPDAVEKLQAASIAPVDLAQAAIGPGMRIFTRYAAVLEADDSPVTVRRALGFINAELDQILSAQDADYDAETRFAVFWFETWGMEPGLYGDAETLATARGIAVEGVVESGILEAGGGRARLLGRDELAAGWSPERAKRVTVWECAQQAARRLFADGELAAAALVAQMGERAGGASALAYRLYAICERKKQAEEALIWNEMVRIWPRLIELRQEATAPTRQEGLFDAEGSAT